MATLTSANSEFILNVPDVFAGPVVLQGYATDDAFDTEDVNPVEAKIGVDGRKSSGFTPYLVKQVIHLQADSPAVAIFDQWLGALNAAQDDLVASASIWSPSLGKAWSCINGSLTRAKIVPDAKKIFESQNYEITWESVQVSNV
jgi:hypothetical protein